MANSNNICKPMSVVPFEVQYNNRARLNIYIPEQLTQQLLDNIIKEKFTDQRALYYYLDFSTAMQLNDKFARKFTYYNSKEIAILNYDLHQKLSNKALYAIVIQNDKHSDNTKFSNRYEWKMVELITSTQIYSKYNIPPNHLPFSSRNTRNYRKQLETNKKITINDIENVCWKDLKQISTIRKSSSSSNSNPRNTAGGISINCQLSSSALVNYCIGSLDSTLIPIVHVSSTSNTHWIGRVLIVKIDEKNLYFGVVFRYTDNKYQAVSIVLERGDIAYKYRLTRSNASNCQYLPLFTTTIDKIIISDNDEKKDKNSNDDALRVPRKRNKKKKQKQNRQHDTYTSNSQLQRMTVMQQLRLQTMKTELNNLRLQNQQMQHLIGINQQQQQQYVISQSQPLTGHMTPQQPLQISQQTVACLYLPIGPPGFWIG